jgi:hypothetical protein
MIPKCVDKTKTMFDNKSNQKLKTTNNTTNNTTITKQPLKQTVIKSLYCEYNELCYPIVYDQYDNKVGKLFTGCSINVTENFTDCYVTDTGKIIEKDMIGIKWKLVPDNASDVGYINKYGGHCGEDLFYKILTDLGYECEQLGLNEKFADFYVMKNNKYYLIQLKTHLSEHSEYVELDDYHLNGLIEWSKLNNAIPVLINYYPHTNSYVAVDVKTNKEIDLCNNNIIFV